MSEESKPAKWTINLGGGEWEIVKYGIVEYLRSRPKMRAATAVTGLLWVLGWLASTAGFRWHWSLFPAVSAIFVTPTLLWFAVVSGPDFCVRFAEKKAPDSPVAASPDAKGVVDAEGYGLEALNRSYDSTDAYGRNSFRWAMFALVAGIAVAYGNAWLISSGVAKVSIYPVQSYLWILAGAPFVFCLILLFRSMLIFRRSAAIHDKLLDLQNTITAIKYLERSKDAPASIDPSIVITKLLSSSRSTNDSKSKGDR